MRTELDEIGPGSLKLIVVAAGSNIENALRAHVRDEHIRRISDEAWIIFTEAEPPNIRDWLAAVVSNPSSILVVAFEHWSGYGDIDQSWLLRRGH